LVEPLYGLNPQLHSWPASLEMVTELAVDVLPPPLLLPELELELQAAASRPAARRTPVVLKRLIVVALH
jgi:hypothetical protein